MPLAYRTGRSRVALIETAVGTWSLLHLLPPRASQGSSLKSTMKALLFATALSLSLMEEDEEELEIHELSEEWQETDKVSRPNSPFSL